MQINSLLKMYLKGLDFYINNSKEEADLIVLDDEEVGN
jgi:hypothetical protein